MRAAVLENTKRFDWQSFQLHRKRLVLSLTREMYQISLLKTGVILLTDILLGNLLGFLLSIMG